jgi:CubicO group peptidase (beta-lactamase class C family)
MLTLFRSRTERTSTQTRFDPLRRSRCSARTITAGPIGTVAPVDDLASSVEEVAIETSLSGVVRVDVSDAVGVVQTYGMANRSYGIAASVDCQFGIASGTKGLTALTVVSLIETCQLDLTTTARSLLGDDLPAISDAVTVEQLLAHRSGTGDYLEEDAGTDVTDYVMPVPVHQLATTEQYLRVLDGHSAKFAPNDRFSYCNSGYVK